MATSKRRIITLVCSGALSAALACAVHAQDANGTASGVPAPAVPATTAPALMGPIPGRSETPMEAFSKLTRNNATFVTRDDVRQLEGFETAFQQADQNGDGRLNAAEFNTAWTMYTGSRP